MSIFNKPLQDRTLELIRTFVLLSACWANLYGVLGGMRTIHDPLTPNEKKELEEKNN